MTTLVLLRHGRSTANVSGVLAGRSEGVELDEKGREQAVAVVPRLSSVTFDRLVSSPLTRCRQTIAPLAEATGVPVDFDPDFAEVDYGDWTGGKLAELAKEPLWRVVQGQPSAAVFPGGEGLAQVSARATAAVRRLVAAAGEHDVLLVCSHGDVIKAILADALGLHLDGFQRIVVAPASISVIRYLPGRTFVERVNDAGDLGTLRPPPPAPEQPATGGPQTPEPGVPTTDAVVGGGA